jgi:hypothetical protein
MLQQRFYVLYYFSNKLYSYRDILCYLSELSIDFYTYFSSYRSSKSLNVLIESYLCRLDLRVEAVVFEKDIFEFEGGSNMFSVP